MVLIRDGKFRVDELVLLIRDGIIPTVPEEFDRACDDIESDGRSAGFTASEDT